MFLLFLVYWTVRQVLALSVNYPLSRFPDAVSEQADGLGRCLLNISPALFLLEAPKVCTESLGWRWRPLPFSLSTFQCGQQVWRFVSCRPSVTSAMGHLSLLSLLFLWVCSDRKCSFVQGWTRGSEAPCCPLHSWHYMPGHQTLPRLTQISQVTLLMWAWPLALQPLSRHWELHAPWISLAPQGLFSSTSHLRAWWLALECWDPTPEAEPAATQAIIQL